MTLSPVPFLAGFVALCLLLLTIQLLPLLTKKKTETAASQAHENRSAQQHQTKPASEAVHQLTEEEQGVTLYRETTSEGAPEDQLFMFHGNWCGPCQATKPNVHEAHRILVDEKKLSIRLVLIEHSQFTDDVRVNGVPHLEVFKKGSKDKVVYQGSRTAQDIVSFALKHTSQ